jgi:hypothetical protein
MALEFDYSLRWPDPEKPLSPGLQESPDCSALHADTKGSLCILQKSIGLNAPQIERPETRPSEDTTDTLPEQKSSINRTNTKSIKREPNNENFSPTDVIHRKEGYSLPLVQKPNFEIEVEREWWTGLPANLAMKTTSLGLEFTAKQWFSGTGLTATKRTPLGPHTSASIVWSMENNLDASEKSKVLGVNLDHDFRYLLERHPTDPLEWKTFYEKYGIAVSPEEVRNPDWVQVMAVRFLVANSDKITPEIVENQFFSQLWVEIQGGAISIQENSPLLSMKSFRVGFGMSSTEWLPMVWNGYFSHKEELDSKISKTTMLYVDARHEMLRISMDRLGWENESGTTARIGAFGEVGHILWLGPYAWTGITRENTKLNGQWRSYGIWVGTTGPIFRLGRGNNQFGETNKLLSLSPGAVWLEDTRNPGFSITTDQGEVFGQYEQFFQMLKKSPENKTAIENMIARLHALSQIFPIIITEDFANSLKDRQIINAFIEYLDKNKALLEQQKDIRTIQFESIDDWLDGIRHTHGTSFEKETGLLRIHNIEHTLHSTIFDVHKSYDTLRDNAPVSSLLVQSGMKVRSRSPLSPEMMLSVNTLLQHAQSTGFFDRLKGKTLEIVADREEGYSGATFDSSRQVIQMTESDLRRIEQIGFSANSPVIEGWWKNDVLGILGNILPKESLYAISKVRLVDRNSPALINPYSQTHMAYDGENGILTISRDEMDNLRDLSEKKANGTIWFFEKIRLHAFTQKAVQAQVYPLVQFDDFLRRSLSSSATSLQLTKQLAGSGTLYDLRPLGSTETEQRNRQKEIVYGVFQANTNEQKQTLRLTPLPESTWKIQIDKMEPFILKNSKDLSLFQEQYPELTQLIFGTTGQPMNGGASSIQGIIRNIWSTEPTARLGK